MIFFFNSALEMMNQNYGLSKMVLLKLLYELLKLKIKVSPHLLTFFALHLNIYDLDLQETPLVALLSLSTHYKIPKILIQKGVIEVIMKFLDCTEQVIRDISIILLKVLYLYEGKYIDSLLSKTKYVDVLIPKDDLPMFYGEDYGGMILEYLQTIIENRRNENYLLEKVKTKFIKDLKITTEELESYQSTFMEIDLNCQGKLGLDEVCNAVISNLIFCSAL